MSKMRHRLRDHIMTSADARSGDSRHHMDHRGYRPTAFPNNVYYTQRGAPSNSWGPPTPDNYDSYDTSHLVAYNKANPQMARPGPDFKGCPGAAKNIARYHNVTGPYGPRPPNATVHHTAQVIPAHSGLTNQARSLSHMYKSQPPEWKWHQSLDNRSDEHSGSRTRGQSRGRSSIGHFRGRHSNISASGIAPQNTPSTQTSQKIHSVITAPSDMTSGQLAAPVGEHHSDYSAAQQCLSMGSPDLNGGPDGSNPFFSQFTHNPCQVTPSTMSASAVSQQGTPVHYASSSGMTQHACSMPVNAVMSPGNAEEQRPPSDLFMTQRDKTPPENPLVTIKQIKQWLKEGIDRMVTTNKQVVNSNRNAEKPNRASAVDILQAGRRQGQPRDKPRRTSRGSREDNSTLRLGIPSSRDMLEKTVGVAPPPVTFFPPLEPETPSQPVVMEGRVCGSTEDGLLSINNGKVSDSCTKNIIAPDDSVSENNVCGKSILERLLAADGYIEKDLSAEDNPLVNTLLVHSESQIRNQSQEHVAFVEGGVSHSESISEDFIKAKESFLDVSSVADINYTLSELRKLVSSLDSLTVPQVNKDNVIDAILDCFWGGDMQNIMSCNYSEFRRDMAEVSALKADENRVVLRAVDGISLEELLDKCPSLAHSGSSLSEQFRSSWLNVNQKMDAINQEPGLAWPLSLTPEIAEAETRSAEHPIDTETSDVEMNEVPEMERGRMTDMETELQQTVCVTLANSSTLSTPTTIQTQAKLPISGYCDCSANGEFCSNCNCFNNLELETEGVKAIKTRLDQNPEAFKQARGIEGASGEKSTQQQRMLDIDIQPKIKQHRIGYLHGADLNGTSEMIQVDLEKPMSGRLGFSVREDERGIFVRSITPGGVVETLGQLQVGDRLLKVNDELMTGRSHVVTTIGKAIGLVRLTVSRPPNHGNTDVRQLSLQEPPEEQELWTSQGGEQLQVLQADNTDSIFKTHCDPEDPFQFPSLDHTSIVKNRETLPTNTTEEQIKDSDEEDYGSLDFKIRITLAEILECGGT